MKLPNADRAQVDPEKILGYLLNAAHPDGKTKAEFFTRFGFRQDRWEALRSALRIHAGRHDVVKKVEFHYGERYVVEGPIESPDRRNPLVRTGWLVERGNVNPRLITAYPVEEGA